MSEPQSVPPTPAPPQGAGAAVPRHGAWRLRLAMYGAFAAVALAVGLQGWNNLRLEATRAADGQILDQAGLQRTFSQQLGREAALIGLAANDAQARAGHVQEMSRLIEVSISDALAMESALQAQMQRSAQTLALAGPAMAKWQDARERLWYRGHALLRQAEGSDAAAIQAGVLALQAATVPALDSAQGLSVALRQAAGQRAEAQVREVRLGVAFMFVLLGVLGLVVVEPTARAVRRHAGRLREQAAELQRLALVAEHTTAPVLITDADDQVVWANGAFTRVTGWSLDEARGQRPGSLLASPQADESVLSRMQQAVREGQGARQEWLHKARDGRELWLDVDLRPLRGEDGLLAGFVRVCTDTSARVQQQAKLRTLWAALPVGVVVIGPDGSVVEVNREAEHMLGVQAADLLGRAATDPAWQLVRADGSPYAAGDLPPMRTLASGLALHNETVGVRSAEGHMRWLLVNTQPQHDAIGHVNGAVSCFSDVTDSREMHDRLQSSARTDALTRLPNRAVVLERMGHAIEHARRHPGYGFAVLFMDFDRFKQVNDTLGHAAGDELLRQIASRLQQVLRPGDAVARLGAEQTESAGGSLAARLGGDEFVVVLDGVSDVERVSVIAHRLLGELSEPYTLDHTPVQSSVSMGVVLCGDPRRLGDQILAAEAVAEDLLRNADTAMYEAKRAGRGRWVLFDDSMHQRVVRALEVEADLRRALKADELFVVYQPVVDLAHRQMVGVEALVRWRHPTRGLVPPVEFVPIAEESGLIEALGAFVLETSCKQFMVWQRELGPAGPSQLAVNLSRAQLQRNGLVDKVRSVLRGCGMAPQQLQLEITESLAAQDERVQATLRELKALGVRLALDDFGTGYSSLACLHQMPVDTVKVDRSFVMHAETVEYHRVLIEATIRVARTMGMSTVAEGIETEGQAALMQALTCDRGQGYLFSRPLEAAALEAWARERAGETLDTV